jgi:hypothetical protein
MAAFVQIGKNAKTRHQDGAEVVVLQAGEDGWAEVSDSVAAEFEQGGWPVKRDEPPKKDEAPELKPDLVPVVKLVEPENVLGVSNLPIELALPAGSGNNVMDPANLPDMKLVELPESKTDDAKAAEISQALQDAKAAADAQAGADAKAAANKERALKAAATRAANKVKAAD